VDLGPCPISTPLLPAEFKILAPSWAISGAPAHLISPPTWEKYVVLDKT